ncbi:unnamed protein product [Protopolystoma xenopodis]|uniref:Uncharacterized protein n=1 Tax=Protopolystoma xenopodis TaxID=117903 RepID=A0A448X6S6_9PLAT|nr:unnamed protein product [Protopolystoma xenopodis]
MRRHRLMLPRTCSEWDCMFHDPLRGYAKKCGENMMFCSAKVRRTRATVFFYSPLATDGESDFCLHSSSDCLPFCCRLETRPWGRVKVKRMCEEKVAFE